MTPEQIKEMRIRITNILEQLSLIKERMTIFENLTLVLLKEEPIRRCNLNPSTMYQISKDIEQKQETVDNLKGSIDMLINAINFGMLALNDSIITDVLKLALELSNIPILIKSFDELKSTYQQKILHLEDSISQAKTDCEVYSYQKSRG